MIAQPPGSMSGLSVLDVVAEPATERPLATWLAPPKVPTSDLMEPEPAGDEALVPVDATFLLDVAHELRSPLFSFNLALAGLAERSETLVGEDYRLVQALRRSAVHMQTLVENLLDAASIGTQRFTVTPAETDVAAVAREAVLVVEPLLELNHQDVALELSRESLLVWADPQRLRQVLVNLLHNAIKYGPRRDTITIRACHQASSVLVEVHDRGSGIPAEEQPHLFERFFRGRTAVRLGHGSGLGLAITRAIVQAHGGEVGVRSTYGEGTTFWLTLGMV